MVIQKKSLEHKLTKLTTQANIIRSIYNGDIQQLKNKRNKFERQNRKLKKEYSSVLEKEVQELHRYKKEFVRYRKIQKTIY